MDKKTLEEIKQELLNQKETILSSAREKENLGIVSEELSDTVDRSSAETDRNLMLKIKDRDSKLLLKIDQALKKFDNNTYGVCDECGNKISVGRLKARPMAELCIDCKEEREKEELSDAVE